MPKVLPPCRFGKKHRLNNAQQVLLPTPCLYRAPTSSGLGTATSSA